MASPHVFRVHIGTVRCSRISVSICAPFRRPSRLHSCSQHRHAVAKHILHGSRHTSASRKNRIVTCVATPPASNGNGAVPSSGQPKSSEVPILQVEDVIQQSTPEELAPLIEALERARMQQAEATGIREALEAEAQKVAQLAINTRDNYQGAQARVEGARAKVEAAQQENFLSGELAKLRSELETEADAGEGEDAAIGQALVTETQDLGIREVPDAEALLIEMGLRLEELTSNAAELQEKVLTLEAKAALAKAVADNADAVASAAMSAAEGAVREEMEAAAVAKPTASALNMSWQS